ncbi:protein trichome birefringence-like 34 [Lactuca sativa]|uniref:protein trichome birefringence-like 34 n=1 Tax=Lactuca sativa TaxID=4236 RepID=UPI000CD89791|nr:protein trichome birefringence-like 34 [Lactuca sativa]
MQLIVICDVKHTFQSSLIVFIVVGAVAATAFYYVNMEEQGTVPTVVLSPNVYDSLDGCDFFSGKWVHDNDSYPLYEELECPYITGDFACQQHGRMDSRYQQWRWQPHGCNLPRFDAKEVLERLRGKRVIFVGDSVNRNQWVSMVCMLQKVIPPELKEMRKIRHVSLRTFKAIEYNVSIDFYWAPLLVESNADHPLKHKTNDRMVHIESIEKHAKYWVNAEVLVLNSYLWWKMPTFKILNGSLGNSTHYDVVSNHHGYNMVIKVLSKWLHDHVNHTRTQLYFMSMTATHHSGTEWGTKDDQNCLNETDPITTDRFWESESDLKLMRILQLSLNKLKEKGVNVQVVNITHLTQYRKDAHPSIHRLYNYPLTTTQLANPSSYADCTHWCLPGVPDVWNELLLTYILGKHK